MNGRIHLKNMAFFGFHGVLPAEQALGQRFLVDVTLDLDIAEAARTDDLDTTVDYAQVFETCRELVERERCKLLEALAGRIMDRILARWPRVNRVEILIKKPSAPIPGVFDYVAVEAGKSRA